tara:strand:+ start:401 stop:1852 length:1452 start_codon:yes stop_codon:yes gene_type:complete
MNKEPIDYKDWLDLGRVIIPCLKGIPKVKKYTEKDFKIEKDIWSRDHETAEIALRLDQDIDLDVDNEFVKKFIHCYVNDCGAIFGREGNPSSHYLWANKSKIPFKQFKLPDEFEKDCEAFDHGAMICELRTEEKRYTIVPGSLHSKSKTNVRWEKFEEIREYQGNLLLDVGKAALSAALTIIYPTTGSRDEYCTAIAGILLKNSDWTDEQIDLFVSRIAEAANDDVKERSKKGTTTRKTDRKFGVNKIHELTGYSHSSIQGLFNWIGIFQEITNQISHDMIEKIVEYGANRYYVYLNVPEKDEIVKRRIIVDGETIMKPKLFYDAAINQAKAWLPRLGFKDYDPMMKPKFDAREKSKDYVKEAEEDYKFKRMFMDYLDAKGVYTDKEQLAIHKMPYYNERKLRIEFNLDNFEKELAKNRINLERVDLVIKIQNILKAKKNHGDYKGKSCVSWLIEFPEGLTNNKIIWEGESIEIENQAGEQNE